MGMNAYSISSFSHSSCYNFNNTISTTTLTTQKPSTKCLTYPRSRIRATMTTGQSEAAPSDQEPPCINFAFVSSVLLPDGTPDVHFRNASGGQKLRDIMLDTNIELYGPYSRPLLNCAGGGTCGTCMVEVIEGKELLNPRTDKEKEKLNRVVIQQLPEWKGHEWTLGREPPPES